MKFTIESKTNLLCQLMDEQKDGAFRVEIKIEKDDQEAILITGTDNEAEIYAINQAFFKFCKPEYQVKLNLTTSQLITLCKAIPSFFQTLGYRSSIKKEDAQIAFKSGELVFQEKGCTLLSGSTVRIFLLKALDNHKKDLGLIIAELEEFLAKQGTSTRSFSVEI